MTSQCWQFPNMRYFVVVDCSVVYVRTVMLSVFPNVFDVDVVGSC